MLLLQVLPYLTHRLDRASPKQTLSSIRHLFLGMPGAWVTNSSSRAQVCSAL